MILILIPNKLSLNSFFTVHAELLFVMAWGVRMDGVPNIIWQYYDSNHLILALHLYGLML